MGRQVGALFVLRRKTRNRKEMMDGLIIDNDRHDECGSLLDVVGRRSAAMSMRLRGLQRITCVMLLRRLT